MFKKKEECSCVPIKIYEEKYCEAWHQQKWQIRLFQGFVPPQKSPQIRQKLSESPLSECCKYTEFVATKWMLNHTHTQGNVEMIGNLCDIFTFPCPTHFPGPAPVLKTTACVLSIGIWPLVMDRPKQPLFLKNCGCLFCPIWGSLKNWQKCWPLFHLTLSSLSTEIQLCKRQSLETS